MGIKVKKGTNHKQQIILELFSRRRKEEEKKKSREEMKKKRKAKSFTSLSMISSFPGSKGFNQNPTEGNLIEEDTFTDLRSTLDPITSSQGKKKKKKKVHF